MKTIVITSGYFNPIHPGHIECFQLCKALGDELRVIVNNDIQARIKTGKEEVFQDENCRVKIVSAIKGVDQCIISIENEKTPNQNKQYQPIVDSIKHVHNLIRKTYGPDTKMIFGKGGDRGANNTPEAEICKELGIETIYGLGTKIDNSSEYREKILS